MPAAGHPPGDRRRREGRQHRRDRAAGADTFVAGSAIFNAKTSYQDVIAQMRANVADRGLRIKLTSVAMALLNIRPATVADAGLILHFIRELAIYEKAEHSVQTDEIGIAESLFGADATARALICEADGEAIGYARISTTTPPGWAARAST
jgi:hypothetical protein